MTNEIEKKALKAIKIAIAACAISLFIGVLSLWVLLNQVTISVGIDKKLNDLETRLDRIESTPNAEKTENQNNESATSKNAQK